MEKIFKPFTVGLFLLAASAAWADDTYKIGQAFQMQGQITNFYGREKSAEAAMWANALKVCKDLEVGHNAGLLLNRLGDATLSTANTVSTASASFVCVPVGEGN